MINVWGDYEHFASHRIWYLKSFREPGNRLPFITTNATGGIVNFNRPREYHYNMFSATIMAIKP